MKTPEQFYAEYNGKAVNSGIGWNDSALGVQCVAGFKCFCQWAGIPVVPTPNNWADGYWLYAYQLGFNRYFDFITDHSAVKRGDWMIWKTGSSCAKSHIAMLWASGSNGYSSYFGERQNGNMYFCLANIKDDWMGALRWKGFDMNIGSWEKKQDQYAGIDIVMIGQPIGDKITVLSSESVQKIQNIDISGYVFDMKENGGFFNNNQGTPTYGEAYGIRCGINEWAVPRQGQFIYYAVKNDGSTEVGNDTDFWYARNEIQCALSPAMVLMHNGVDSEFISPSQEWRRNYACAQSLLIRTNERFIFAISKGKLTPDQCRAWAKSIDGVQDLVFNDAGGSTCMQYGYDVITGTGENRAIANVWAFYHDSEPKEEAHEEVTVPDTETPETPSNEATEPIYEDEDMEDKTISGQLAKLIDVKSIITIIMVMCLCYLVITGQEIDENFMHILTAIVTFYFGYQASKAVK